MIRLMVSEASAKGLRNLDLHAKEENYLHIWQPMLAPQ